MFNLELSPDAFKFLKKSTKEVVSRVMNKIDKLREEPFPSDVKRIVNRKEKIFRVRVGDYRIQYIVDQTKNTIIISQIAKRARAY
ncbi:TPA: type II toxin-antitoxin system RelE/ParE family toxin [Candidatus Woesearchaeota archaeon]|nr:hypothetical protein [archaeon]HIJ11886.1 type II toxin-antitoxin system RelE/ParE family toxin [Candidatus Woesearchaeota archaeon]|tara:strand:+ start:438 stop:692 length:255 start_codon:yes stop_codon:yes gene_type:complete